MMLTRSVLVVLLGLAASPAAFAQQPGVADANKALVRRFYEQVYHRENLAAITQLLDPNCVAHLSADRTTRGPVAIKQAVARLLAAFPDLVVTIEGQMADGDQVITRWTLEGTHRGEWREISPTGRRVRMMGITIFRLAGDRIVESWETADELGLLQQIVPGRLSDQRRHDREPDRRTDHGSPDFGINIGYWVTHWRTGSSKGSRK
jgi:predicted ester cyclase